MKVITAMGVALSACTSLPNPAPGVASLDDWRIEAESPQAHVRLIDGSIDIDTPKGLTLWWRRPVTAPVIISFDAMAMSGPGANDQVSDLNAFWMATNRDGSSVLTTPRSGAFATYDDMRAYYVGIGGNRNSTTRMRRYVGRAGDRPLLPDHDRLDPAAMLTPNRWFHLRLIADGGHIAVERDGETLFAMTDRHPYRHGHFGVRTTQSHIQLRNFAIIRL